MTIPTDEIWELILDRKARLSTGGIIKCSLFGRIRPTRLNGQLVGEIPKWLETDAKKKGLKLIGADFRNNCYTFEVL